MIWALLTVAVVALIVQEPARMAWRMRRDRQARELARHRIDSRWGGHCAEMQVDAMLEVDAMGLGGAPLIAPLPPARTVPVEAAIAELRARFDLDPQPDPPPSPAPVGCQWIGDPDEVIRRPFEVAAALKARLDPPPPSFARSLPTDCRWCGGRLVPSLPLQQSACRTCGRTVDWAFYDANPRWYPA